MDSGQTISGSAASPTSDLARHLRQRDDGQVELEFLVPGMHCAGCMQKIERALGQEPAISHARTNLSTRRVLARWRPEGISGEDIIGKLAAVGFDATPFNPELAASAHDAQSRELLKAMAVAGFAAGNIMLLSVSVWAGLVQDMEATTRHLFHWIAAAIALPTVAYSGRPFFRSALKSLSARSLNMDVPIAIAVILAAGASLFETMRGGVHVYFDASVGLLFFLLIGRYLDQRMRARASSAVKNLLALQASSAEVVAEDGSRHWVEPAALEVGMTVAVPAGGKIPCDGDVVSGQSTVDTSLVTGESLPRTMATGDGVFAGTVNLTGPLLVRVTAAHQDTVLAEVVRLMEAAEQGRNRYVRIADRVARVYAPTVHILAAGTFAGWLAFGFGWHPAMMAAIAVLIITCPCALGLAVPVVQVVAGGRLFERGILIKSPDALERLAEVDVVVFDKTGTITTGSIRLANRAEISDSQLTLAAALARHSTHPLSAAIVAAAGDADLPEATGVTESAGHGLAGTVDGRELRLGSAAWIGTEADTDDAAAVVWLGVGAEPPVYLRFESDLRADAVTVVDTLKERGYAVALISGDRPQAVAKAAAVLGITQWEAEAPPARKTAFLEDLADKGQKALMVGDGINDAPALAAAHASLSPASAADVSQTTADCVFQGDRLAPVVTALDTAKSAHRLVTENFGLSFLYNVIAVPLAVAGLVTPLIAAIAMSSSSLVVTLNALRLRLLKGLA